MTCRHVQIRNNALQTLLHQKVLRLSNLEMFIGFRSKERIKEINFPPSKRNKVVCTTKYFPTKLYSFGVLSPIVPRYRNGS